jgi:hypothetical protein
MDQSHKPGEAVGTAAALPATQDESDFVPSPDEVARRAYFTYLNEGAPPGREVQHWLDAEAQLLAERKLTRTHGFHNGAGGATRSKFTAKNPAASNPAANPQAVQKSYGIEKDLSADLNALMNQHLVPAVELQMQITEARWGLKGSDSIGLPGLFDQLDEIVESYVRMLVDRVVQLAGLVERSAASQSLPVEHPRAVAERSAHQTARPRAVSAIGQQDRQRITGTTKSDDIRADVARAVDQARQTAPEPRPERMADPPLPTSPDQRSL